MVAATSNQSRHSGELTVAAPTSDCLARTSRLCTATATTGAAGAGVASSEKRKKEMNDNNNSSDLATMMMMKSSGLSSSLSSSTLSFSSSSSLSLSSSSLPLTKSKKAMKKRCGGRDGHVVADKRRTVSGKKKSVSFDLSHVKVHSMMFLAEDISSDGTVRPLSSSPFWLESHDYSVIRGECLYIVSLMRRGVPESSRRCYRGLEWKRAEVAERRRHNRECSYRAVFSEQDRQYTLHKKMTATKNHKRNAFSGKDTSSYLDAESIAECYANHTRHCHIEARHRALSDAEAAAAADLSASSSSSLDYNIEDLEEFGFDFGVSRATTASSSSCGHRQRPRGSSIDDCDLGLNEDDHKQKNKKTFKTESRVPSFPSLEATSSASPRLRKQRSSRGSSSATAAVSKRRQSQQQQQRSNRDGHQVKSRSRHSNQRHNHQDDCSRKYQAAGMTTPSSSSSSKAFLNYQQLLGPGAQRFQSARAQKTLSLPVRLASSPISSSSPSSSSPEGGGKYR